MDDNVFVPSTLRRIFAYGVDRFFIGLGYAPVLVQLVGSYLRNQRLEVEIRWVIAGWLFAFLYNVSFLYYLGATLGKLLFRLRVISQHGELTLWQAILRVLTNELSIFFGLAPRALALLRLDRTHLADWVAETRVVQFSPRNSPPIRRKILAPILIVFLAVSGFYNFYSEIHRLSFSDGVLTFDTNR
jgi:uncharacterized RDD family membrane protein YckC